MMTAEIIPFAQRRRIVPCACRYCRAVQRNWHRFGSKQPLAEFLAEHALYRDPPSIALGIIADKAKSKLARAQARTVLRYVDEPMATPNDAA
jgi:hypothetical protein